jgi:FdhE protein
LLARQSPAAQEPLEFAAGLYRTQARMAGELATCHAETPLIGRLASDLESLLPRVSTLLRYAAEQGPEGLSEEARSRQKEASDTVATRLSVFWAGDRSSAEDYLSRAILRPYVELLRSLRVAPDRTHSRGHCPFCGGAAWISARRDGATMEGARRTLGCALCGQEWLFERILCASCFEEDPHKLPSFRDEKNPAVRIESCDTCHRYIKSIDLSEDARPIPEVDDLATLAMDLWAQERGLTRIEPGLAGI